MCFAYVIRLQKAVFGFVSGLFMPRGHRASVDQAGLAQTCRARPGALVWHGSQLVTINDLKSYTTTTALTTLFNAKVNDGQVLTNVPAGAVFTDTVHTHTHTPDFTPNLDDHRSPGSTECEAEHLNHWSRVLSKWVCK